MNQFSVYILKLDQNRWEVLEEQVGFGMLFAEPVQEFEHNRNLPLICFLISDGRMKFYAKGRRGLMAGTGIRRLNLDEIMSIDAEVVLENLLALVPKRFKKKIRDRVISGGVLPPKSSEAFLEALFQAYPLTRMHLNQYSKQYVQAISDLLPQTRQTLAFQKEAVSLGLSIAGMSRKALGEWRLKDSATTSFLDGLPSARLREDPAIIQDFTNVPGFNLIKTLPYGAAIFEGETAKLTVIIANRQPLEHVLGVDLIYYNEQHKCFVMVQFKMMEEDQGEVIFRLPNTQLALELGRMEGVLQKLRKCTPNDCCGGYRINDNPFFLKLCPRVSFNPNNSGLVHGMYLPIDYWKILATSSEIEGPRGGRGVTYKNVGRYIDNTEFISLIAKSWVGTTVSQSGALEEIIRAILETGRAVVFCVKTNSSMTEEL